MVCGACVSGSEDGFHVAESQDSEAVGDRHHNDAELGEAGAVEERLEGPATGEASAVNPDEDRVGAPWLQVPRC